MRTELDFFRTDFVNPWKEFASLQRRMDHLLEDFINTGTSTFKYKHDFIPASDVEEDECKFTLTIDVPGIPKNKIKIEINGDALTVSGEHAEVKKEKQGKARLFERSKGRFEKTFILPRIAVLDKIQAEYKDGVIQIVVPKSEVSKTQQVPIAESKGAMQSENTTEKNKVGSRVA